MGNRCRLAARKGTQQQAADYCKEDGDFKEWGTPASGQGARTDLITLRNEIKAGATAKSICWEDPHTFHTYGRTLQTLEDINYENQERKGMTRGIWYVGGTATGKSFSRVSRLHQTNSLQPPITR